MLKSTTFMAAGALFVAAIIFVVPLQAAVVVFEAEDFSSQGGVGFSTLGDVLASKAQVITTNGNDTSGPDATVVYDLNFSEAGDYYLYARLYAANPPGGLDDSFYTPPDFGTYEPYDAGFESGKINNSDVVTPAAYLWHNLTLGVPIPDPPPNANGRTMVGNAPLYTVTSPGAQTFTIGGRENGLLMDTFVLSTNGAMTETELDALLDIGGEIPPEGPSAYANAVSAMNPDHYYRLSETLGDTIAADSGAGSTINGTKSPDGGLFGVMGPRPDDGFTGMAEGNRAYQVGTSAVDLGDGAANFAADQMTVAMWIKPANNPPGSGSTQSVVRLFTNNQYDPATNDPFYIILGNRDLDEDGLHLAVDNDDIGGVPQNMMLPEDVIDLNDGLWHFIFAVRDGDDPSNLKLVVDGVDRTNDLTPWDKTWGEYSTNFQYNAAFGTRGIDSGKTFNGSMDEVAFWIGEARSVQDGINLYNASMGSSVSLQGDLNGDGFVGGDDLDIVRSFWGQNVTPGDLLSGDPSEDGFVGGDDLDIVRANWGQGTPPAPTAVPEPSLLVLLLTGAGIMLLVGRR